MVHVAVLMPYRAEYFACASISLLAVGDLNINVQQQQYLVAVFSAALTLGMFSRLDSTPGMCICGGAARTARWGLVCARKRALVRHIVAARVVARFLFLNFEIT